ncbi:trypsin-like peptidase domain-containing protein [Streptomyces marokkonensis]|uniref:trypsin-like peptidase domain-containing protein n=1 Tax=Streptomyces marokkonensis TaxID=324855 RepID=UPI0011F32F18|nr:trypsin-like peptidase domain-containing protein [Streptomyces marokkonensis]
MNNGKPGPPGEEPTVRPEVPDGDFELARPAGAPATTGNHEGDYELDRPRNAGNTPDARSTPTASGPETTVAPAPAVPAGRTGGSDAPAPPESGPAPTPGTPADAAGSQGNAEPADVPGVAAPGEPHGPGGGRTRPLHDPDPYSTPPYGEPGPWAPAPPVQHPAATPAHGMASVAPPAATATPIPAQAHPDATDAPPADPWGRYDPWAAAAAGTPLRQAGPAVADGKRRRGGARRVLLTGALMLALVSGGIGGIVGAYLERNGGVGTVELPQAGKEASGRDPGSVAGIAAQALPSVVTLHVSGAGKAGTGTGFVLDGRGHILTNNHVVEPAGDDGEITVTFHSGDTAEATVVGRDSGYDLAVVKVKGVRGLAPLPLGNSDNVRVGDPVVAIGAPFDLAGTVTSGIISARERPITAGGEKGDGSDVSYVDALQTDAPINPGNSGGPLLDAKARVIGINSAIRSADGGADLDGGRAGSIGLGFAIPINQGKRVAEELINTGSASHPVIGITLDMDYSGDGARVAAKGSDGGPPVSTGGPGAEAGIEAGDVITEVDGRRVHSGEELIVKTRAHRPGDRLELTLERDGKERTVSLVLGSSDGG